MTTPAADAALIANLEVALDLLKHGGEWEWRYQGCEEWADSCPHFTAQHMAVRGYDIRRKPWSLPAPPAGREWHRADNWTEEMLPEGYRPLLAGEAVDEDQDQSGADGRFLKVGGPGVPFTPERYPRLHYRTRRPLPPVSRPWASPDDVPGPVCWIRSTKMDDRHFLVVEVGLTGLWTANASGNQFWAWGRLKGVDVQHSTDRREWQPCERSN